MVNHRQGLRFNERPGEGGPFHKSRMSAVLHAVDRGDIGVIQRSEHLRFAGESRKAAGVVRERFG